MCIILLGKECHDIPEEYLGHIPSNPINSQTPQGVPLRSLGVVRRYPGHPGTHLNLQAN